MRPHRLGKVQKIRRSVLRDPERRRVKSDVPAERYLKRGGEESAGFTAEPRTFKEASAVFIKGDSGEKTSLKNRVLPSPRLALIKIKCDEIHKKHLLIK